MLKAGVARTIITPPLGLTMMGYAGRDGAAREIDSDLLATLLVLDDERTRIAILSVDLGIVGENLCPAVRGAIASALGTPPDHILVNYSHTHCGPTLKAYFYDTDPKLFAMRDEYEAALVEKAGQLAREALGRLTPTRIGTAAGQAQVGINRREVDEDGKVFLGENPEGVVDHEVRVIRVDDLGGRPLAIVFAHGCHTVTMGPKCLAWSPDYVGPARQVIESAIGCPSLFLQANGGDINPKTGIGANEDDSENKNHLGWILGGEVVRVLGDVYTHSVRGPRVFFGMLSKASMYPRIPLTTEPDFTIRAVETPIELPLYPFPSLEEAREIERTNRANLQSVIASGQTGALLNVSHRFHYWSRVLLEAVESGRKPSVTGRIQTIAIGDLAIAAYPGETFAIAGLEVKRRSPFSDTLFLGYSNGAVSYVPTRDAYPPEGWSIQGRYGIPDMHFKDYGMPTALLPGASEAIVDRTVEQLHQIRQTR